MKAKLAGALLCLIVLSGCQSTQSLPEWISNPKMDSNREIYSTGQGISLSLAKKKAISSINERLWTQVESSGYHRQVANDINGNEHYQQLNDVRLNVKTAPVVLTGIKYLRIEQVGNTYFVEANVAKDKIKSQLISEIKAINDDADTALISLKHSDPLVWWLKNRDIQAVKDKLLTRQAMLLVVSQDEGKKTSTDKLVELERTLNKVKDSLLVRVDAKSRDNEIKGFLIELFNDEVIKVTSRNERKVTHNIKITTDWRQNTAMNAYISTVVAKLLVKNKRGKTIGSSEVIATGNSISNYKMSKEGAARHFSAQVRDRGIWHSLGLI